MAPTNSFIIFGTITQESRLLWMSPTAYDVLGYEPEDLIGESGYKIVSPDDLADIKDFRREHYMNDYIASQVSVRLTRKDGVELSCVVLVSLCYHFTVSIVTIQGSDAEACKSDQWRRVDSWSFTAISFGRGITLC
jgi:PAS domain S-box-containing protein